MSFGVTQRISFGVVESLGTLPHAPEMERTTGGSHNGDSEQEQCGKGSRPWTSALQHGCTSPLIRGRGPLQLMPLALTACMAAVSVPPAPGVKHPPHAIFPPPSSRGTMIAGHTTDMATVVRPVTQPAFMAHTPAALYRFLWDVLIPTRLDPLIAKRTKSTTKKGRAAQEMHRL